MKRLLLLISCLLVISSAARADFIGVYSDASGASCNLGNIAGQFSPTATVIQKFSTGATGSRFKVTFPAGTTFFGFNSPFVPVGDLNTDLSLGYGLCLTGPIILGNILAIYGAGIGKVEKADLQSMILYTNCLFAELPAEGGEFAVSAGNGCNVLPVEPSTWGKVKSLYR